MIRVPPRPIGICLKTHFMAPPRVPRNHDERADPILPAPRAKEEPTPGGSNLVADGSVCEHGGGFNVSAMWSILTCRSLVEYVAQNDENESLRSVVHDWLRSTGAASLQDIQFQPSWHYEVVSGSSSGGSVSGSRDSSTVRCRTLEQTSQEHVGTSTTHSYYTALSQLRVRSPSTMEPTSYHSLPRMTPSSVLDCKSRMSRLISVDQTPCPPPRRPVKSLSRSPQCSERGEAPLSPASEFLQDHSPQQPEGVGIDSWSSTSPTPCPPPRATTRKRTSDSDSDSREYSTSTNLVASTVSTVCPPPRYAPNGLVSPRDNAAELRSELVPTSGAVVESLPAAQLEVHPPSPIPVEFQTELLDPTSDWIDGNEPEPGHEASPALSIFTIDSEGEEDTCEPNTAPDLPAQRPIKGFHVSSDGGLTLLASRVLQISRLTAGPVAIQHFCGSPRRNRMHRVDHDDARMFRAILDRGEVSTRYWCTHASHTTNLASGDA